VSSTRTRILDAAREITEKQGAAPTMSALARAVGISRQALYLHFPDRTQLLLALIAHAGEQEQLQSGVDAVTQAPDAAAAIRAWAYLQAQRRPKLAAAGRALADTRHADPSAAAAWADRARYRMRIATSIIERLREEGRLDPSWMTAEAAALLWELNSFHVWDDLVNDAQITPGRYVEIITATALSALGAPIRQPASPKNT
jgi:AcrR family transcriptional regulator